MNMRLTDTHDCMWNKQDSPIAQHRELDSVCCIMEKNLKKNSYIYIYIYAWWNHFSLHVKLTHCNSTILQLKKSYKQNLTENLTYNRDNLVSLPLILRTYHIVLLWSSSWTLKARLEKQCKKTSECNRGGWTQHQFPPFLSPHALLSHVPPLSATNSVGTPAHFSRRQPHPCPLVFVSQCPQFLWPGSHFLPNQKIQVHSLNESWPASGHRGQEASREERLRLWGTTPCLVSW